MDPNMTLLHQPQPLHNAHPRRKNNRNALHGMPTERLSLSEEAKLEMASLPTKTPVSVLQELLSRRGATPKYELVQIEGAIHEPIFRYRVFINNDFVATGTGRSKKDAKHAAAKNLLDVLVGKQSPEQANASNGTPGANDITTQVVSPFDDKVMGNPIGWLQEMCMSRRWPPPSYEMEHEEGLPHERQFTIACSVLKYREVGTGKSKKLAKRMAAHKMWQALQEMPLEGSNMPQGYDDDEELSGKVCNIQGRYNGLKDAKIQTLNNQHSHKVSQFHKALKQSSGPKLNELQNVILSNKDFNFIQFLQEIASEQQFELTYVDIEEKAISDSSMESSMRKKKTKKYIVPILLAALAIKSIIFPLAFKAMAVMSSIAVLLSTMSLIISSIVAYVKLAVKGDSTSTVIHKPLQWAKDDENSLKNYYDVDLNNQKMNFNGL